MANQSEATLLLRIKKVGENVIEKTGEALSALKDVAVTAYAQISVAVGVALAAWREQEQATNKLNQVMVQNGIYTRGLAESYASMASQLQGVSTYGDEAITSAIATTQQYLKQIPVTKELTTAILDFATAQGIDLDTAAQAVGKSIGTSTNALARYGIEISEGADASQKMAEAVSKLNSRFGGQAAAATKGLGAITQMQVALGDVAEAVGEAIAPAFSLAAKYVTEFAKSLSGSNQMMQGFSQVALFVLKTADILVTTFQTLGAGIGALFAAFGSISLKDLSGTAARFKEIGAAALADTDAAWAASAERRKSYEQAVLNHAAEKTEESVQLEAASAARKIEIKREETAIKNADFDADKIAELIKEQEYQVMRNDVILQADLARINQQLANETNRANQLAILRQKEQVVEAANVRAKMVGEDSYHKFKLYLNQEQVKNQMDTMNQVATLQNAKTKELAVIGKAAAIAMATINTAEGVTKALSAFPPPFSFAAAAAVGAAGAVQIAKIGGVALAEGGIVPATAGGIQATIGEGGASEAVIPLDSDQGRGMLGGGGVTVNFNGPLMGDQAQAREFAVAIDRELYRLRRDGGSISFDSQVS